MNDVENIRIQFRVMKFDEYDFGFYPITEDDTQILIEKMEKFFPDIMKVMDFTTGLMAHLRFKDYEALKFWSDNISNYVHETEESPEKFEFVIDGEDNFILSETANV